MATVNALIKFKGNAEEALNAYKDAFDGEFLAVLRYGDNPEMAEKLDKEQLNKLSFIALDVGNHTTIMASDILEPEAGDIVEGNNVYIYINAENNKEVDSIFAKLSKDGSEIKEPVETPWGSYYCEFTDRFGISWMVNYQRDLGPLSRRP